MVVVHYGIGIPISCILNNYKENLIYKLITLGECRVLSLLSFCGNQEGAQSTFISWRSLANVSDHGRYLLNARVPLMAPVCVAVNVAKNSCFNVFCR